MQYNTQKEKLLLPEYGRNIQNMVDHCVAIDDPNERKRCAYAVIDIMGSMFPHLRDVNNFKHILWDHLAIMSDFKLDIEYPYEVIKKEDLYSAPGHLDYSRPTMRYRHYGKLLERMVRIAADMEEGEAREHLIRMLLGQMKRSYSQWNKEADDEKIFYDLRELSDGKINMNSSHYVIPEVKMNANNRDKLKNIKYQRRK
ncbi:MAG: DUF4290 domain-containing protein [Proteiniphilum sp.]|jgi:hypothetical protein|nr:DUF4290 domain-containing protein [Proteiniphilum sp.]NCD14050.1 DUF4290 domain-containing protein [Bacteroidia bacterium]MDD2726427.1 DUF4290 domain-containing protein [Proteiniphilum sp.]MDD3332480.1 DUF4290 domain-containing protein [Proteiniphilum sp.]MDD3556340.1 DUF4290 domain-containing protein [Proteiniphilum sp.]